LSEFDLLDEMTVVPSEFTAKTMRTPPADDVKPDVIGRVNGYVPASSTCTTT
jgi:hypothetical protein